MNTNTTRNNKPTPKQRRGAPELGGNDALTVLGAALNHVGAAGLPVTATNEGGALIIRIDGAQVEQAGGQSRFKVAAE